MSKMSKFRIFGTFFRTVMLLIYIKRSLIGFANENLFYSISFDESV
jgi:hypothetical protein